MPGIIADAPEGCEHFDDASEVPEDIVKSVAHNSRFQTGRALMLQ